MLIEHACNSMRTHVMRGRKLLFDHLDFDIDHNSSFNSIICLHVLVSTSLTRLIYTKPTVLAEMTHKYSQYFKMTQQLHSHECCHYRVTGW